MPGNLTHFFAKKTYIPSSNTRKPELFFNKMDRINEGLQLAYPLLLAIADNSPTAFLSNAPFQSRLMMTVCTQLCVVVITGIQAMADIINDKNLSRDFQALSLMNRNKFNRELLISGMGFCIVGIVAAVTVSVLLDKMLGITEDKNALLPIIQALYNFTRLLDLRKEQGESQKRMRENQASGLIQDAATNCRDMLYYNEQIKAVGFTAIGSIGMLFKTNNNFRYTGFVMLLVNYFQKNIAPALEVLKQVEGVKKGQPWENIYVEDAPRMRR